MITDFQTLDAGDRLQSAIDHILADDHWIVVRSQLGPVMGSDHAPILADLRLRTGATGATGATGR